MVVVATAFLLLQAHSSLALAYSVSTATAPQPPPAVLPPPPPRGHHGAAPHSRLLELTLDYTSFWMHEKLWGCEMLLRPPPVMCVVSPALLAQSASSKTKLMELRELAVRRAPRLAPLRTDTDV